jgi:orotate phosphoribosyltransferase
VIVGIPRSGMLAANMLALYLNLPLTDLDGLIEGRCMGKGNTRPIKTGTGEIVETQTLLSSPRNVLIVDDSIFSGGSLRNAMADLKAANLSHHIRFGVVYVTPETAELPDFYCEVLQYPRVFEWNVMHHNLLEHACVDMDGVLCTGPVPGPEADEEKYRRSLCDVAPFHLPSRFVGHIVTVRPEKYRRETEKWLQRHGVDYGQLIMMDDPYREAGKRGNAYSAHKAKAYRDTKALICIEGDLSQAVEIAALAMKDVLCTDTMQMISPGMLPVARPGYPLVDNLAPSLPKRIVRRVVPKPVREQLHALRRSLRMTED